MSDNNILIIGNGFDLHHGLPTRYTDFLVLVKEWNSFYNSIPKKENYEVGYATEADPKPDIPVPANGRLAVGTIERFKALNPKYYDLAKIHELNRIIKSNYWIKYFLNSGYEKDNWIDFELEIESVVLNVKTYFDKLPTLNGQKIDLCMNSDIKNVIAIFSEQIEGLYLSPIHKLSLDDVRPTKIAKMKEHIINNMKNHLDMLINALDIYFNEFVNKFECIKCSPAISHIYDAKVLSFNYTSFISKYPNIKQVHFVHGKLSRFSDDNNSNIVLGINDERVNDNDYLYFFKYFQRIQKRTGTDYKAWLQEQAVITGTQTIVYVFGHSLDANDKSVLSYFFENEMVDKIAIFYISQSAYEQQVINLIKMFGKEYVLDNISSGKLKFISINECEMTNKIPHLV